MPYTQRTRPDGSEEYRLPRAIWLGLILMPVGLLLLTIGLAILPDDPDALLAKFKRFPWIIQFLIFRLGFVLVLVPFILSLFCLVVGMICLVVRVTVVLRADSLERTVYVLGWPLLRRKALLVDIKEFTAKGMPTVFVNLYFEPAWLIRGFGSVEESERFVKEMRSRVRPGATQDCAHPFLPGS